MRLQPLQTTANILAELEKPDKSAYPKLSVEAALSQFGISELWPGVLQVSSSEEGGDGILQGSTAERRFISVLDRP